MKNLSSHTKLAEILFRHKGAVHAFMIQRGVAQILKFSCFDKKGCFPVSNKVGCDPRAGYCDVSSTGRDNNILISKSSGAVAKEASSGNMKRVASFREA